MIVFGKRNLGSELLVHIDALDKQGCELGDLLSKFVNLFTDFEIKGLLRFVLFGCFFILPVSLLLTVNFLLVIGFLSRGRSLAVDFWLVVRVIFRGDILLAVDILLGSFCVLFILLKFLLLIIFVNFLSLCPSRINLLL
jgi:hypothetical protein